MLQTQLHFSVMPNGPFILAKLLKYGLKKYKLGTDCECWMVVIRGNIIFNDTERLNN